MKKKRSTKSRVRDILVTLLCLSGATLSLWLFWKDFNAVMKKLNELPIATVSWKYRASQRKFSDRLIWDRLQQDSPVYNGDTIRTSEKAETTITFENSEIQLGENTIIQIQVDNTGMTSINMSGGMVAANTSAGSKMQLRSGNVTVDLEEGTTLNANTGAGDTPLSLQVTTGNATVSGSEGSVSLVEGDGLSINAEGHVTTRPVTVLEPAPQIRQLKFEGATLPIGFKWRTNTLPENSNLIFETSLDREFTEIVEQIGLTGLSSMTIDFPEGISYWRFYAAVDGLPIEETMEVGRIEILNAQTPTAIVPLEKEQFSYRTKLPIIRFMWNGNEYASSYLFEIADNPQMSNPTVSQISQYPSSIVSVPSVGTWYWRVTPYYTFNGIGYGPSSAISSFAITQQGELDVPQPVSPQNGELVNILNEDGTPQSVILSWKRETEAQSYTVRMSKNQNMSDIVENITIRDNYADIQVPSTGRWYWDVVQIDIEGNVSQKSPPQNFMAVDSEVEFQSVYPPEGYNIANTRINDIRFTWKNNLDESVVFQISDSPSFDSIVYENTYTPDTVGGFAPRLKEGTWYWRIQSGDGSTGIISEPKTFQVVPQLPRATGITPISGTTVISRPEVSVKLWWTPVPGADYYQVFVYEGYGKAPIVEELFYENTEIDIYFDDYPEGTYRWTIQAFSNETPMSTRVTGLLAESFFTLKKIYPVTLQNPGNGHEYEGYQAYTSPDKISFSTRSSIDNYEILIVKDGYSSQLPTEYGQELSIPEEAIVYRGTRQTLPPLGAGKYWWTVTALTEGTYDISNDAPNYFTVLPVEPFPPVRGLKPENGSVFDENYLVNSTDLQLGWDAIPDAEAYQLIVTNNDSGEEILNIIIPAMPNQSLVTYTLDLTQVGLADFTWTVKARRYVPSSKPRNWVADMVLKDGLPATGSFLVTLPSDEIVLQEMGDVYGN